MIRQDRKSKGGGVAFMINKRIKFRLLKSKATFDYEYIAIEINSANENITLLNSYVHPKSKSDFKFIDKILNLSSNKVIWVGDLNATNISWYCQSTSLRGKSLENICSEKDFLILNSDIPTSRKSTNIIDMIICSDTLFNRIEHLTVDKSFDLSDHWPVHFQLGFNPGCSEIKKINWNKFKIELDAELQQKGCVSLTLDDLEQNAEDFARLINSSLVNNTFSTQKKPHGVKLPSDLYNLIRSKKKLSRLYSSTHDPGIKNLINCLNNKINAHSLLIKNHQNQFIGK
jgi:hypothetical protein